MHFIYTPHLIIVLDTDFISFYSFYYYILNCTAVHMKVRPVMSKMKCTIIKKIERDTISNKNNN